MSQWHLSDAALPFVAAAAVTALVLLAMRALWRNRTRRRRAAVRDTGLHLMFDACAPEGGDVTLEPFGVGRLRNESLDGSDERRRG
jgi:hypothetical protein